MASTVSVSKGVFAFKRRLNHDSKQQSKKLRKEQNKPPYWPQEDDGTSLQQQKNYSACWETISDRLQKLEMEIHQSVFEELVSFVGKQHNDTRSSSGCSGGLHNIPAAILVTGVNMPDSGQVLASVDQQMRREGAAAHVARLHSRNCSTIKNCIVSLVSQLVNAAGGTGSEESSSEEEEEEVVTARSPSKRQQAVKKNNCTMPVLEAWYREQSAAGNIAVLVEDVESFATTVLQDFIQIASHHRSLPLVLVLCVATSPAALHGRLSQPVLARLAITTFQARPSHHYLTTIVDTILMDTDLVSFRLGGRAFKLLLDMFLYHHLSINNFVHGLKYCLLEHFLSNPASVLCCAPARRAGVLETVSGKQLHALRKLHSFRNHVESLPSDERAPLLLDDKKFKRCVLSLLQNLDAYHRRLCTTVRALHLFTASLPGAPLGRQVWSLVSLCLNSRVADTEEFKEAWQLLESFSREELLTPLPPVVALLSNSGDSALEEAAETLTGLMENLLDMDDETEAEQGSDQPTVSGVEPLLPTDRFKLKEKLQQLARNKQAKPNKYQSLRADILGVVKALVEEHLIPPTTQPLHEVMFFNNSSDVADRLQGRHRAAITKVLSDPAHYLQCECCADSASLGPNLPDLSLVYRLHLECGRLINLYDWLQAFSACAAHPDHQEGDKKGEALLQARFVQAVSELQFLGFIKTSKRKTDHVARLTWGTC